MTIYQYGTHSDIVPEAEFAFLITDKENKSQTIFRPGDAKLIKRSPGASSKFIKFTYTTP